MAQFARPDSNVTQTGFTNGFSNIDETPASDADFAFGANNTAAVLEVGLSNVSDPNSSSGHTFRYRIAKTNSGTVDGAGNAVTVTAELYQGSTLIAADTAKTADGTWTQYSFTLSGAQADSITDYTDLRLRFTTSSSGGSPANRRGGAVSWAELEVPTASLAAAVGQITETDAAQTASHTKQKAVAQVAETNQAQPITLQVELLRVTWVQMSVPGLSAQNIPVAQATSLDTALAVTPRKTAQAVQCVEADTAQQVTWDPQQRLIGGATETDTAEALTTSKIVGIQLATQTDLSQTLASQKQKQLSQVSTTDVSQAVTSAKITGIALTTEIDESQIVLTSKQRSVAQIAESDTAQDVSSPAAKTIAQAPETDLAQSTLWAPIRLITRAEEASLAQLLLVRKTYAITQASEADLPQALAALKFQAAGQVLENDLAQAAASLKTRSVGQTSETDTSQAVLYLFRRLITSATEADLAQLITSTGLKVISVEQVTEADVSQAAVWPIRRLVDIALEASLSQTVASSKRKGIDQAVEANTAQQIRFNPFTRLVLQVIETSIAQAATIVGSHTLGQAIETDLAQIILSPKSILTSQAMEASISHPIGAAKMVLLGLTVETDLVQLVTRFNVRLIQSTSETDLAQILVTPKTITVQQTSESDLAHAIAGFLVANLIPDPRYTTRGNNRDFTSAGSTRKFSTSQVRDLLTRTTPGRDFTA